MKRFWVFVIICVVALGVGFTVFKFMTKEEIFYVNQTVYEINSGENVILDIVADNLKGGTEISVVSADPTIIEDTKATDGTYNFKAGQNGGKTVITVTTNRNDLPTYTITVSVGNGSYATPYFIKTQNQLEMIGKPGEEGSPVYGLTRCYKLVANINLTGNWTPIGEGSDEGFTGNFDFNGHTISNINVTGQHTSAGLFAKIGESGNVRFANISSVNIDSQSTYAGALAGVNLGTVENAYVTNARIENSTENAFIGGLVGLNNGNITKSQIFKSTVSATGNGNVTGGLVGKSETISKATTASISRSSAECVVHGSFAVGGLVGQSTGAIIENCYAGSINDTTILTSATGAYAGGIVGILDYATIEGTDYKSYLGDTYSVMSFSNTSSGNNGAIIGHNVNASVLNNNVIYGSYYSKEINEGLAGVHTKTNQSDEIGVEGIDQTASMMNDSIYKSFVKDGKQYNWQFAEGVWYLELNRTLPKLSFDIGYVASRVSYFVVATDIKNVNDFNKLKTADTKLVYKLRPESGNTLELTAGEDGYVPFDFDGKLTCDVDANGLPLYSITLVFRDNTGVADGVAALFKSLGANAELTNIRVYVRIEGATNAHHVAAFAGYNEGAILNCYVSSGDVAGQITVDYVGSETVYVGGFVAENKGKISNCKSYANINYAKSPAACYVGGIAAHSTNSVQFANNYGKLEIKGKGGATYVGGILGYTSGQLATCANYGKVDGETEAGNTIYAGIVGYVDNNNDATVKHCANYAEVYGSNVGGVVGTSLGAIEYCYNKGACTGKNVGGLAYSIKLGYMKNSMTDAYLYGSSDSSVICGVVYSIDVTANHSAYCEYIFSASNFGGLGQMYYESASNIRGDSSNWAHLVSAIDEHAFDNCIHIERSGNIKRSRFDANTNWWDFGTKISWGVEDIQISEEQASGSDGAYSVFTQYGYSQSIWYYSSETVGQYIQLREIAK